MKQTADIEQIARDLQEALARLREHVLPAQEPIEDALAEVETFCAIALRVLAKTNPSKLRAAAMTVEIAARIHGRAVKESP